MNVPGTLNACAYLSDLSNRNVFEGANRAQTADVNYPSVIQFAIPSTGKARPIN